MSPRWGQVAPKCGARSATRHQNVQAGRNMAQDGSKVASRWRQDGGKLAQYCKILGFLSEGLGFSSDFLGFSSEVPGFSSVFSGIDRVL